MNNFKQITAALLMMILSIITGCSDEYLSPLSSSGTNKTFTSDEVPSTHFETVRELKAGETILFHKNNTGLTTIEAISIEQCDKLMQQLEVTGYTGDMGYVLGCDLKGFAVRTVMIRNISNRDVSINIHLYGKVEIIPDPVKKEKDNE